MTEELPEPALDEPAGDMGDQAFRLQMAEEQEAIRAALAGHVHGTDALEGRGPVIAPLEGPDVLDGDEVEASDDPVHGGGMPVTDPEEARSELLDVAVLERDLAMTGLAEDGAAMAVEEGSSVADDDLAARFELDGDPDVLDAEITNIDDETGAEDLDSLVDVSVRSHEPDDPQDPDGYGVPPGADVPDEDAPQTDRTDGS